MSDANDSASANVDNPGALPEGPDAALLAEIESLQLVARQVAQGALAGMHRALRRGTSIEFSEHKLYTPGDDIRHIDWRAFAKTDRYHVKQFEDETNLWVEILIDHSGSMGFASGGLPTKLTYARQIAAALSYLALRQGDATGLSTFAAEVTDELPARSSSGHLLEVLTRLARLQPSGPTGVAKCIDHFSLGRRRRSVAVVLTDLFDPSPALMDSFRRLAARRHDVSVLHLLDPAEIQFPYETPAFFVSMEDTRRLFVHPRTLRHAFVHEMQRFRARLERELAGAGITYHPIQTDTPPAQTLAAFLRHRESRR